VTHHFEKGSATHYYTSDFPPRKYQLATLGQSTTNERACSPLKVTSSQVMFATIHKIKEGTHSLQNITQHKK